MMKPEYAEVIFDDFLKKYNNPNNAILKLNKTLYDLDEAFAIADQGSTIIMYNCIAYEYITDVISDKYNIIDKNNNIFSRSIDYTKMLPVELYYYVVIISGDINALSEFEEFYQSYYAEPQKYSIELPLDTKEKIHYSFSIIKHERGDYSKSNPTNCTNKPLYVSEFNIKGENCISFTEKYSAAQLELVKGTKEEVIERLSALEAIKMLLIQNDSSDPRINDVESAWNELNKLIDCTQGITTYHDIYKIMHDNKCTPEEAVDIIKKEQAKQLEKERLEKKRLEKEKEAKKETEEYAKKYFTKCGDIVVNQYTDAVVNDVKSKLNVDFNVNIYGGSTYSEWCYKASTDTVEYPVILVSPASRFHFDVKNYQNINNNNEPVQHTFTTKILPYEYGIAFDIYTTDIQQEEALKTFIRNNYTKENTIYVQDPVLKSEKYPLRIQVSEQNAKTTIQKINNINIRNYPFYALQFPCVYHVLDYSDEDVIDNQQLEYRLLQLAEFYSCCINFGNQAISQFNSSYKPLFSKHKSILDGLFQSKEYKQIRDCIAYNRPIDKATFDKEFAKIIAFYPNIYYKTIQGITTEAIEKDMKEYLGIIKNFEEKLYSQLGLPKSYDNINLRDNKAMNYILTQMSQSPFNTLEIAANNYVKQQQEERAERQRQYAEEQEARSYEGSYFRSSIVGDVFKIATGVALGNKVSQSKPKTKTQLTWKYACSLSCPRRGKNYGPTKCRLNPETCGYGMRY